MSDVVFPQVGDLPDSAFFSALIARKRSGIISGLTLNADFTVPEVTVQPGFAVVASGSETTQHPNITPAETIQATSKVVDLDAQTEPLTDNAVNSILINANISSDDDPQVIVNTTENRQNASVKIGEVDTSANTVEEQWNLISGGVLTFPSRSAADKQSDFLREGEIVYARDSDVHFFVS
jgi:hypothetical protein